MMYGEKTNLNLSATGDSINNIMEKTQIDDLYTRINLERTDYDVQVAMATILKPNVRELRKIYYDYCKYKEFASVTPLHDAMRLNDDIEVIGYYEQAQLVAFSLMRIYDHSHVENIQFAWNYRDPKTRLGIKSLEAECAYFKARGFKFLELGLDAPYKRQFNGFEIMGPA